MERFLRPERFDGDPSLSSTGLEWVHWKRTFDNFIAVQIEASATATSPAGQARSLSDGARLQLLINHISPRVFSSISDCKTYDAAMEVLDALYVKPKNEITARHLLATRRQHPGETIDMYLQALKQLARECEFKAVDADTNMNDNIRGAFIAGISSARTRERLLENFTLTLDEAYKKAQSMEMAENNSRNFISPAANTISQAQYSDCHGNDACPETVASFQTTAATRTNTANNKLRQIPKCFFCGGDRLHNRKNCPAFGTNCKKCGKKGHFASVCRSQLQAACVTSPRDCAHCSSSHTSAAVPASLRKATVPAYVKGIRAEALIDTGSSISFINEDFANLAHLRKRPCYQMVSMASTSLTSQVTGTTCQTVQLGENSYSNVELLAVKDLCADIIIGHDLLSQHSTLEFSFGGPKEPFKVCCVAEATVPAVQLFANLTTDCKPIAIRSRRYSQEDQEFIAGEVKKLLQQGIIEESQSPWRAQVLITKNANHKKRMCIDYSQTINRYTLLDAYPLPNIEEIVTKVAKYSVFSAIDLQSAYHQIPILTRERPYTAFEAAGNLYQFCRIPFGVTNGVSSFQRTIDWIIRKEGLDGTFAYLDDITICGNTQLEHDRNLNQFLQAARKYGLTLNKEKSKFNQKSLNMLGYFIEKNIIKPDSDRLNPLINLPPPNDTASLRRALGMFAHYSKWIPNYSKNIHALAHTRFPLSAEALKAFDSLKSVIAKSAIHAIDDKIPFTVETDASEHTIAATLSQDSRPVAFYSRTLNKSEHNHSAVEKEAYAIVESLKKWRHFLIGKPFKLITDQRSVAFMFDTNHSSKIKNEKIQRWRLELAPYTYDIVYRPGRDNFVADTLSRVCASIDATSRLERLKKLHGNLCHPGVTRMHHWLKTKNLAYTIEEIRTMTNNCSICAEIKPRFYRNADPPPELIKATSPFERLSIDFKGPVPTSTNNRYILTIIDEFSRFPFAFACSDMSAKTVIKHLNNLFMLFGMPNYIHSDRGTAFLSSEVKEYLHSRGIATSRTTAYNPQGNGQVEKLNSTLWKAIRLGLRSHNLPIEHWEKVLDNALHSIRSLLCTTTNCTPHERMFKHSRKSPNGNSIPTWLSSAGQVLVKRCVRANKYQPTVEEAELIEVNPDYSIVRLNDGRETAVSNRHLAPIGEERERTLDRDLEPTELDDNVTDIPTPQDPDKAREASALPPESPGGLETPEIIQTSQGPSVAETNDAPPSAGPLAPQQEWLRRSSRPRRLPSHLRDYKLSGGE